MPKTEANGVEIAYQVQGQGFPLVRAHGYTASQELWADQRDAFSRRYQLVTYDCRGHGLSEAPADPSQYSLDIFVEDQKALLDQLGTAEAYVGGLSMGGMIAMRFALKYPKMVRALLLLDTAAGLSDTALSQWHAISEMAERIVRSEGVGAAVRRIWEARRQLGFETPDPTPGVLRHLEGLEHMSADGFLGAGKALREQESVLDRLAEIRAPTLILVGDQDPLLGPSRAMRERLPQSRFVLIKGSTHGTCVWRPDAFEKAALDFLTAVDQGRTVAGEFEL